MQCHKRGLNQIISILDPNSSTILSYLSNQFSTPGASMMQDMTAVKRSTRAYINLARAAFAQELGHTAHVVLTQVPVMQQARLLKLSTPPIFIPNIGLY